ncbi:hypothetical protein BDV95DRAFT_588954 [Massariosphaeria phaeospora]|uniref:Zn(2)-C6 fungal-type domain-containing protein n=1 Tax=Massariosphaeria phaeospora TaxID=100035 RepID=A0A7C8MJP1_9PLEO|nr:hypothetical protein BDV95DRAFT_588954 [Massariosphaeria phaeospora]
MPPPANRKSQASRKVRIPHDFMIKWQSSGPPGTKPVRRPMTACQTCRTAKVKCDGQQECGRCISRGITCIYTDSENTNRDRRSHLPVATDTGSSSTITQVTASNASIGPDANGATNNFTMDFSAYGNTIDHMPDWEPSTANPNFENFDWGTLGPTSDPFELQATLPELPDLNIFRTMSDLELQCAPAITPSPQFNFGDPTAMIPATIARSTNDSLTHLNALFHSSKCRCRDSLGVLLPEINTAIQGNHLDEVFKVTLKVVNGSQAIVDCTECQITCTDLICLMAVFQRTDPCFEYIATAEQDTGLTMSFGGYEVPINDPKLRAVLVIALLHEAETVLDAISAKGQYMLRTMCRPTVMARANISYLDIAVTEFKEVLGKVADSVNSVSSSTKSQSGVSGRPVT